MSQRCLLVLAAFVFSHCSPNSQIDDTDGNASLRPRVVVQLLDQEKWKKVNLLPDQIVHLTYYDTTTTFDPVNYTENVISTCTSFRGRILHIE